MGGPSSELHQALLMMALYENHACWRLDVVTGEWRHINPLALAPAQNVALGGPTVAAPLQQPTDQIRAEIATLEARSLSYITPGNVNWWRRS